MFLKSLYVNVLLQIILTHLMQEQGPLLYCCIVLYLFVPEDDSSLGQVVRRHFDVDLIPFENADAEFTHFTSRVSEDLVAIL